MSARGEEVGMGSIPLRRMHPPGREVPAKNILSDYHWKRRIHRGVREYGITVTSENETVLTVVFFKWRTFEKENMDKQ